MPATGSTTTGDIAQAEQFAINRLQRRRHDGGYSTFSSS
jgi:hypothetical protein